MRAFISLYALIITLAISLTSLYTLRTLAIKKDITLTLYFQKQASLYAKALHDIALQCYKQYDKNACQNDFVEFDSYFSGEYRVHEAIIRDTNHLLFGKKVSILDITIYAQTPLSTHALRYAKRYVLQGVP